MALFSRLRLGALASALSFLLLAGCGSGPRVDGTVTLDGQPVDGGSISLIPSDGGKGKNVGGEIKAGKYSLDASHGLVAGAYRVEINWMKKTGKTLPNASDPGTSTDETKQVIPVQYNAKTELKTEVGSGSTTANFDLKSGGAVVAPGGQDGGRKTKAAGD